MKPETIAFLEKADRLLATARGMLKQWPDQAGRTAYLAGFHAAQAFLFERTERSFKTHSGVHGAFAETVKADSRFDLEQRRFLGRTYSLKTIADYETDAKITETQATEAIAAADRFIVTIRHALPMP